MQIFIRFRQRIRPRLDELDLSKFFLRNKLYDVTFQTWNILHTARVKIYH